MAPVIWKDSGRGTPLPPALAPDDYSGGPDGHREIEGKTPKQLPAPEPKADPTQI
jgi:hypothetical protein